MAMSGQGLVSSHFPYLPISLQVGQQSRQDLEALVDTGFDGEVVAPRGSVSDSTPPDGYLPWMLADGSEVLAPSYLGTVRIGTMGPFPVVVSLLGDEPIVGCALTNHFSITFDHGQRLVVEP